MESSNLQIQHHQLQEQLTGYGVGGTYTWTPNLILSANNFNQNFNGLISNSMDLRFNNGIEVPPPVNSSMIQELGFPWACNVGNFSSHSANEQNLTKTKQEISHPFPKFSEMFSSPSNVEEIHIPSTSYIKNEPQDLHAGFQINGGLYTNAQNCFNFGDAATTPSRGNFSQIYPSIHISNSNRSSSSFSSSMAMNLQALDLFNSSKFGGSFVTPSFGLGHKQESSPGSSSTENKMSSFTNGVTETKRHSTDFSEDKASHGAPKKPRLESRSSFPPIKVRKEKLGDRIAALQQLVAPFGKTDTASVLMEAIGYIKFLQDQVETLSVPYMKSSRIPSKKMLRGSNEDTRNEEPKRDLRSRGLCLMPISCTSCVTSDEGGVWLPLNFS